MRRYVAVVTAVAGLALLLFTTFTAFADGAAASVGADAYQLVESPARAPDASIADGLRDAWIASRQFADASTVFYPDERIPISDTTTAPWRDVAYLFIQKDGGYYGCSGSMLSANVVLTAAHCLFDGGAYADAVLVSPGSTPYSDPYGYTISTNLAVPKGWANDVGQYPAGSLVPVSPYDFGIVILDGAPFGSALSPYMTIANVTDAYLSLPGTYLATAGFPGDKADGSMWFTASTDFSFDDNYICTRMDVFSGQSGSPIIAFDPDDDQYPYVFSVVSVGNNTCNTSVRFTDSVITALDQWCAEDGCSIQSVHLSAPVSPAFTATPTSTPSPTPATPSPTPTHTPSPTPTSTPANTGHSHRVSVAPGLNVVAGPLYAALSPADVMSCAPAGTWSALYAWDTTAQRWRHWFGPGVPGYVNGGANSITSVPRGAGIAILVPAGTPTTELTIPDDNGGICQ